MTCKVRPKDIMCTYEGKVIQQVSYLHCYVQFAYYVNKTKNFYEIWNSQ